MYISKPEIILFFFLRFTKNLSANNIHLDTFKGEGTLKCLELDENVLTELLELPVWMKLTNAWCNSVAFSVQWTKLKSVPIHLVSLLLSFCQCQASLLILKVKVNYWRETCILFAVCHSKFLLMLIFSSQKN